MSLFFLWSYKASCSSRSPDTTICESRSRSNAQSKQNFRSVTKTWEKRNEERNEKKTKTPNMQVSTITAVQSKRKSVQSD